MTSWAVGHLGPDVPMHFTAFHPDFKMTDRPCTLPETLAGARRIALANGLRYAYTGNVHETESASTYCSGCGASSGGTGTRSEPVAAGTPAFGGRLGPLFGPSLRL